MKITIKRAYLLNLLLLILSMLIWFRIFKSVIFPPSGETKVTSDVDTAEIVQRVAETIHLITPKNDPFLNKIESGKFNKKALGKIPDKSIINIEVLGILRDERKRSVLVSLKDSICGFFEEGDSLESIVIKHVYDSCMVFGFKGRDSTLYVKSSNRN